MDSFFGIGAPELIFILILAGIVMGPQRISQVARWLGKTTAQLQRISRRFMRELNADLAAADKSGDLKGALDDIQSLRQQVTDLKKELRTSTFQPIEEGKSILRDSKEMLNQSIGGSILPKNSDSQQSAPLEPSDIQLPNLVDISDDPE